MKALSTYHNQMVGDAIVQQWLYPDGKLDIFAAMREFSLQLTPSEAQEAASAHAADQPYDHASKEERNVMAFFNKKLSKLAREAARK